MNHMTRTIKEMIEWSPGLPYPMRANKAFQLIKYVTGKSHAVHTDYEVTKGEHYGHDTLTIKGQRGFVRVSLEPLFKLINE